MVMTTAATATMVGNWIVKLGAALAINRGCGGQKNARVIASPCLAGRIPLTTSADLMVSVAGFADVASAYATVIEQRRGRKAAVEPNQKARPWKRTAQQRQQPCQQGHAPFGGDRLAVPQHRRTQILLGFAVERQEREQRQVTPVVIVPIEEAVLWEPCVGSSVGSRSIVMRRTRPSRRRWRSTTRAANSHPMS